MFLYFQNLNYSNIKTNKCAFIIQIKQYMLAIVESNQLVIKKTFAICMLEKWFDLINMQIKHINPETQVLLTTRLTCANRWCNIWNECFVVKRYKMTVSICCFTIGHYIWCSLICSICPGYTTTFGIKVSVVFFRDAELASLWGSRQRVLTKWKIKLRNLQRKQCVYMF